MLGKLYEGKLSLPVTFWIFGYAIQFLFGFSIKLLDAIPENILEGWNLLYYLIAMVWLIYLFIVIHGLFICATNYQGLLLWKVIAYFQCIVWVLGLLFSLFLIIAQFNDRTKFLVDNFNDRSSIHKIFRPYSKKDAFNKTPANSENDNSESSLELARLYFGQIRRDGIEPNFNSGYFYLIKAAENGDVTAASVLGDLFRLGSVGFIEAYNFDISAPNNEISINLEKSIYWYRKAAIKGSDYAQLKLSELLSSNETPVRMRNIQESFFWSLESAKQGNDRAMIITGLKYIWGEGTDKNSSEGLRWLLTLGDQEKEVAYPFIGAAYAELNDWENANLWFEKTADARNPVGHRELGISYLNGRGLEESKILAYKHLKEAVKLGSPESEILLDQLCKESPWACN